MFALGVIAYQLVVGDRFAGPGADAEAELRDRKVPRELTSLIVRSVSLNSDRRPADAGEWLTALDALISRSRQPQEPTDSGSPSRAVLVPEPALQPTDLPQTRTVGKPPPLPRSPEPPIAEELPEPKARRKWVAVGCVGLFLAALVPALVFALRPAPGGTGTADHSGATGPERTAEGPTAPGPERSIAKAAPEGERLAAQFPTNPKPGQECDVEIAPGVKMRFCWVPAGECQLGSPRGERLSAAELNPVVAELEQQMEFERLRAGGKKPAGTVWQPMMSRSLAERIGHARSDRDVWYSPIEREDEGERGTFCTPGFWLGKYEVTQAEWAAVLSGTAAEAPSSFRAGGDGAARFRTYADTRRFPVENVSWHMIGGPGGFLERANTFAGGGRAEATRRQFDLP
ncbi:MAG: hypothetical protein K2X91_06115, partial [Thermoleophilia bacterium]|nr:hypothetical protein [Thermoleophilia bacterium]